MVLSAWPVGAAPPERAAPARPALVVQSYLARLEVRLRQATQFALQQPNAPPLWAAATGAMSNLLTTEWRAGRLVGTMPAHAFGVRCDRSTMTQADVMAGRMVCVVLVAERRPAEFSVIRVSQWTADHRARP